ncbi:unnamed protein product [Cyclocybe aegerita]|uniref:Uncharacterized protein n=1 Tax=Cyclocybe aegerita TaxID=1973307 RepID=A0A8S0WVP1_CYCAE|nr:unnamed protein product [Cyclocybe aegerita]
MCEEPPQECLRLERSCKAFAVQNAVSVISKSFNNASFQFTSIRRSSVNSASLPSAESPVGKVNISSGITSSSSNYDLFTHSQSPGAYPRASTNSYQSSLSDRQKSLDGLLQFWIVLRKSYQEVLSTLSPYHAQLLEENCRKQKAAWQANYLKSAVLSLCRFTDAVVIEASTQPIVYPSPLSHSTTSAAACTCTIATSTMATTTPPVIFAALDCCFHQ